MATTNRFKNLLFGAPRGLPQAESPRPLAFLTCLAWLGADVLSSICYGPEEAFIALGSHTHLGLYLALATAATVFIISLAYNQVIELFPSGGGGYKVTTQLLGPRAGLVAGAALLIDYVLTIAISIAASIDALFSLLPLALQDNKLTTQVGLLAVLFLLNLRGLRESPRVVLVIFAGFFLSHALLIGYGVHAHLDNFPALVAATHLEMGQMSAELGWIVVVSLFLRAYCLGGGTYTGLEAIANNVNILAEPRVRNGKRAMLGMAVLLSFIAGGVILLYLLWSAERTPGQTLNAVVFRAVIGDWVTGDPLSEHLLLGLVLTLEAGLLLTAANAGFLSGPAILANLAVDSWVPRHFRSLSASLVTEYGVVLMGAGALGILLWTRGQVHILVVLYSINVFLTFALSLLGLVKYWWSHRLEEESWRRRLWLAAVGLLVAGSILLITLVEKFAEGGWLTVLITSTVVALCLFVRRHYDLVRDRLRHIDDALAPPLVEDDNEPANPPLDPQAPTAVFLVGKNRGIGMHSLLWVRRTFPGQFKNFIFLSVGEVDSLSFAGQGALRSLQYRIENSLNYFIRYCRREGLPARMFDAYGTDPVAELEKLTLRVMREYPNSMCFSSKLIFEQDTWLTPWLHNQTPIAMQRRLHLQDLQMVLIPLKV